MDNDQKNQPQADAYLDPCVALPSVDSPIKDVSAASLPVDCPANDQKNQPQADVSRDPRAAPPPVCCPSKSDHNAAPEAIADAYLDPFVAPPPVDSPTKDVVNAAAPAVVGCSTKDEDATTKAAMNNDQKNQQAADSHVAPAPVGYPTKDGDAAPAASGPVETQSRDGLSDCAKVVKCLFECLQACLN
ncbi:hypothetical protein ACET3Z_012861 [Daucus carota]